jgi:hypothetical protein
MIPISQIEELLNSGDWFGASSALYKNKMEESLREEIELRKAIEVDPALKPHTLLESRQKLNKAIEQYNKIAEFLKTHQPSRKRDVSKSQEQAKEILHTELVADWVQAMHSGMIPGKKSKGAFSDKTIKDYQSYILPFLEQYQTLTMDSFITHLGSMDPEKYAAKEN